MDTFTNFLEKALLSAQPAVLLPPELPPAEVNKRIQFILNHHPELFWFQGKWRLTCEGGNSFAVPVYEFPVTSIADAGKELDTVAKEFGNADGFEAERAGKLFVRLAEWCDYGEGPYGGQTAYEALVSRTAYCKGLSKAYQLLLQRTGIPCRLVAGSLWNRGRHIWNEIQTDGKWVTADVSTAYPEVRRMMKIPSPVFGVDRGKLPACYHIESVL